MKLYLEPRSGLANRIRAIVSGIGLAEHLRCEMELVWKKQSGLNCGFHDIFQPIPGVKISEKSTRTDVLKTFRRKPAIHKLVAGVLGFGFTMYDYNLQEFVWSTADKRLNPSLLSNIKKDLYINSSSEFWFQQTHLTMLRPVEAIQEAVQQTTRQFQHTIGLHIRRTDHKASIAQSPVEAFEQAIANELELLPASTFYLATDDLLLKEYMNEKYPGKMISNDVPLYRNTKQGIMGAMIDLYCLAATKKIYGSYGSSYSDMAARIGQIPLVVAEA